MEFGKLLLEDVANSVMVAVAAMEAASQTTGSAKIAGHRPILTLDIKNNGPS
jgi:hypothetical protein